MHIYLAEKNTYFSNEENRQKHLHHPNDFLLESVALRLYAETYLEFADEDDSVDFVYKNAFEFANDAFVTGGYLNFVEGIHSEFGWIEKLFLFQNGSVGAVITPYADNKEEEDKIAVIELY